jgi:hypothetical protein
MFPRSAQWHYTSASKRSSYELVRAGAAVAVAAAAFLKHICLKFLCE